LDQGEAEPSIFPGRAGAAIFSILLETVAALLLAAATVAAKACQAPRQINAALKFLFVVSPLRHHRFRLPATLGPLFQ
jgi:hypothetical protein